MLAFAPRCTFPVTPTSRMATMMTILRRFEFIPRSAYFLQFYCVKTGNTNANAAPSATLIIATT